MAYNTVGLKLRSEGVVNEWVLQTVDSIATATGASYITDAAASGVNPGRGMQVGDIVHIHVVGAVPSPGMPPATVTAAALCRVTAIASGAATIAKYEDLT